MSDDDGVWHITKEEAAAAVRAAAVPRDIDEDDELVIHSFLSFIGADHSLAGALDLIERSTDRAWFPGHMLDHDLAVLVEGRIYRYSVKAPEREVVL